MRESGWLLLAAGLLFGLGVGAAYFYGFPGAESDRPSEVAATVVGQTTASSTPFLPAPIEGAIAPDFELLDLDGNVQRLSDLRGSVVLLSFWASWCPPCEAEMPMLNAVYQRYRGEGLAVVAVDFDEPESTVRDFRDRLDLSFPVVLDPGGKVQQLYRILGYPTTFLVDRDGVIRAEHIGILSETNLSAYLSDQGLGDS